MLHDQDQVRAEQTKHLGGRSDALKEGQPHCLHGEGVGTRVPAPQDAQAHQEAGGQTQGTT